MVIAEAPLTLKRMLEEMDIALGDEIEQVEADQRNWSTSKGRRATDGRLKTEQAGRYLYDFTLEDHWEPKDDTPVNVRFNNNQTTAGTIVHATGTTVTIATESALPTDALHEVYLIEDTIQLLKRLREALKSNKECPSQPGSKCFGLLPFSAGIHPPAVNLETKFRPFQAQENAIKMALGSEVTYIVGPPGTGKTYVLAAIAFAYMREGKTVLIASHTNIAVDNAIMRIADICRDTNMIQELKDGAIIRYGAPQLTLRLRKEYKEVYLPVIVEQRSNDCASKREALKAELTKVEQEITEFAKRSDIQIQNWQIDRQNLVASREAYNRQLVPLQNHERQRISVLQAEQRTIEQKWNEFKRQLASIEQELRQLASRQTELSRRKQQYEAQVKEFTTALSAVQQMNAVKRFFKGVNRANLEQQLVESKEQVFNYDKEISSLQQLINERFKAKQNINWQFDQSNAQYKKVEMQRTMRSPEMDAIEQLQSAIAQCEQTITQGDNASDQNVIQQQRNILSDKQDNLRQQLALLDKQFMEIEARIVDEAKVIATTLSKTYMNNKLQSRQFDVVIMDEVSMAPLPTVYLAASRATQSVVVIGDPRQLSPIFEAKRSQYAKKWLGEDLFALCNISLDKQVAGNQNSVLLDTQFRMHPDISRIAREHVYEGRLKDAERKEDNKQDYSQVKPVVGKSLLLCDTTDAVPFTTRPQGKSRINVYHALCAIELAKQVLATLPPSQKPVEDGMFRVGIVTPYAKQANLLDKLVKDAGLGNEVRVGTVHRFQGLEAEAIIFDTVESAPLSPVEDFTMGRWMSKAMRLVNVAVTRAQHKLIIIANRQYIEQKFSPQDTLRLAVQGAAQTGCISSLDILKQLSLQDKINVSDRTLVHKYQTLKDNTERLHVDVSKTQEHEVEFLNDQTFYPRFFQDIQFAKKQIIIYSPFVGRRANEVAQKLAQVYQKGVRIKAFIQTEQESKLENQAVIDVLKKSGVELYTRERMHEKLVFIDDEVFYTGSLNVLSHSNTSEFMQRTRYPRSATQLRQFMEIDTTTRKPKTLREKPTYWGQEIVISMSELPAGNPCPRCGSILIPRYNSKKNEPFYGCPNFRSQECKGSEDVSESHLRSIQKLAGIKCGKCGGKTKLDVYNRNAQLTCDAPTPCGHAQNIVFVR